MYLQHTFIINLILNWPFCIFSFLFEIWDKYTVLNVIFLYESISLYIFRRSDFIIKSNSLNDYWELSQKLMFQPTWFFLLVLFVFSRQRSDFCSVLVVQNTLAWIQRIAHYVAHYLTLPATACMAPENSTLKNLEESLIVCSISCIVKWGGVTDRVIDNNWKPALHVWVEMPSACILNLNILLVESQTMCFSHTPLDLNRILIWQAMMLYTYMGKNWWYRSRFSLLLFLSKQFRGTLSAMAL